MARYLYRLQYTKAGLEGTVKEGFRKREDFFGETVKGLGGSTESANWAYGDTDIFIITDFPEAAAAKTRQPSRHHAGRPADFVPAASNAIARWSAAARTSPATSTGCFAGAPRR